MGKRRVLFVLGLVPLVVLAAGTLAGCAFIIPGGTASVSPNYGSFFSTLHFDAAGGRDNDITVSVGDPGSFGFPASLVLTDARNGVTPGPGCTPVALNTVRCSFDATRSVGVADQVVRLGDGNDTYTNSVPGQGSLFGAEVHAGAG